MHKSFVSSLLCLNNDVDYATCGGDGYVKLWKKAHSFKLENVH